MIARTLSPPESTRSMARRSVYTFKSNHLYWIVNSACCWRLNGKWRPCYCVRAPEEWVWYNDEKQDGVNSRAWKNWALNDYFEDRRVGGRHLKPALLNLIKDFSKRCVPEESCEASQVVLLLTNKVCTRVGDWGRQKVRKDSTVW